MIDQPVPGVTATALTRFLNRARREVGLSGKVTLLVASSRRLRQLNREFRNQDHATDVLSFPSELPGYAGDIAISADIARRNGEALQHGTGRELKILILHGLLHLAGYDHESDGGRMARRELRLRRALALPEGLIERADAPKAVRQPGRDNKAVKKQTAREGRKR